MGDYANDAVDLSIAYELDEDDDEYQAKAGPDWGFGSGYLGPRVPRLKTCNRCGAKNLFWKELTEGWRLHTAAGGKMVMHTCQPSERPVTSKEK